MSGPVLSVRGEASATVMPDLARLRCTLRVSRGSKAEALHDAAAALDRLLADLAELGGVPRTADTDRAPLTWSTYASTTHVDQEHDERTGRFGPTGTVTALVAVLLVVRALDRLDALGPALAAHESLHVDDVTWDVDADNAAWPDVRADAIRAAIRKGRDYATALGGSLSAVEHIADAGLLGGAEGSAYAGRAMGFGAMEHMGGSDAPSLDPVPQVLTALIEARFVATGVTLDDL